MKKLTKFFWFISCTLHFFEMSFSKFGDFWGGEDRKTEFSGLNGRIYRCSKNLSENRRKMNAERISKWRRWECVGVINWMVVKTTKLNYGLSDNRCCV